MIRERVTGDHLSVLGGMTPENKVYMLTRQESLNRSHGIEFLTHLTQARGRGSSAGDLGRLAHPPPGCGPGVRVGDAG